jgi:NAD(P)-dependent dehydrogenase (short-subunit alcohol dehydrogenase family)
MSLLPEYDIAGRKALLVGASRGVGKGIAMVLAEAGAEVAIASLNPDNAGAAAKEILALGGKAAGFGVDATSCADMQRLAQEMQDSFGLIDVLVNCVGDSITRPLVPRPGHAEDGMTEQDWRTILDVNLTQVFAGCKAFGPHFLRRRRGSVINISTSIAAFRNVAGRAAYIAAKGGVISFTEALALEWAPFQVRVNSIAPGSFPDETQQTPEQFKQVCTRAAAQVPLGRAGRLREAGLLALYLASDASAFVTGQTWCIDGGAGIA